MTYLKITHPPSNSRFWDFYGVCGRNLKKEKREKKRKGGREEKEGKEEERRGEGGEDWVI